MRSLSLWAWLLLIFALTAGSGPLAAQDVTETLPPPSSDSYTTYELAPGDRIKIDIFNHVDLSGEFTLDADGRFSMPLIGTIDASDLNPLELEDLLVSNGYLSQDAADDL